MGGSARLILTSFQDGRAIIAVEYGGRHARLELDLLEDRYSGQATEDRAREEIGLLADALRDWLQAAGNRIESD